MFESTADRELEKKYGLKPGQSILGTMTQEEKVRFRERLGGRNGKCIVENCTGTIVARFAGTDGAVVLHGTPFCDTCKEEYIFANAKIFGHKEYFAREAEMRTRRYGL